MEENGLLSFQIFLLKTSTVWPLQTKNAIIQTFNKLYFVFTCILLTIVSISLVAATLFSRDLRNISSTVDIATLTISALYKLGFTKLNFKRFRRVVSFVDKKFKKFISNKNGELINVETENLHSSLYSSLLIGSGVMAALFWGIIPVFEPIEYEGTDNSTDVVKKKFPLACWIPFDATWSPVYEIIYTLEGISFFLGAHIYLTKDAFFFTVIYQICIQLKMLSMMIANIETDRADFTNKCITFDTETRKKDHSNNKSLINMQKKASKQFQLNQITYQLKLKECIAFHRDLLWIMAEIEDLYRSMILADVLHAIISLSFALFETGTTVTITGQIKMYSFLLICIVHQFLNSHYGQMFITAQEQVLEGAYNSQWYKSSIESRKYLVLILARSNKMTILNGGKMYNLCRASFVLFSKTLFSYYMVLRQVTE